MFCYVVLCYVLSRHELRKSPRPPRSKKEGDGEEKGGNGGGDGGGGNGGDGVVVEVLVVVVMTMIMAVIGNCFEMNRRSLGCREAVFPDAEQILGLKRKSCPIHVSFSSSSSLHSHMKTYLFLRSALYIFPSILFIQFFFLFPSYFFLFVFFFFILFSSGQFRKSKSRHQATDNALSSCFVIYCVISCRFRIFPSRSYENCAC